jgi:hypothetical protein
MRWTGHVARLGEKWNACRILIKTTNGKSPLGRIRRRRQDDIKIDLREIDLGNMDWIYGFSGKDQCRDVVCTVTNCWVP